MMRRVAVAVAVLCLGAAHARAQTMEFPNTAQGKLAAGFFAAVNAPTEDALATFQEANFSQEALNRRPKEERLSRNRQVREVGTLTLVSVVSAAEAELVVTATASNAPGMTLRIVFGFTGGSNPKINTIEVTGGGAR